MSNATAIAHPNIALVKYWGNRDDRLRLPAMGSISVTLAALSTRTRVSFDGGDEDRLILNGQAASEEARQRTARLLDLVRGMAGARGGALVESVNDFPTAAGLASSASGFAALALAATRAAGLDLGPRELSILARQGSGSAARSVFGGYVEMHRGERSDGLDSFAEPLASESALPLEVLVAVTEEGPKERSSQDGMALGRASSPFWDAWVSGAEADVGRMRASILAGDLAQVGALAEESCLKMHAVMLSTRPALIYLREASVAVILRVRALRKEGLPAWITMDAGPQVKVLTSPDRSAEVVAAVEAVPGVLRLIRSGLGPGVALVARDRTA
ncbi:MAG: diphosphomevalonate decarboxylase [Polyangia bacterium]|nr:diphosphomevalonate decarboxylase [Polyangia bacterium]